MILPGDLVAATGMTIERAGLWAAPINLAAEKYEFESPMRMAMWLAQCGHESSGFRELKEKLKYTTAGLMRAWPKRFPTVASAQPYALQPEKIANKVYANRMGNGPEESGDGWRYCGHGLIQLTGKTNHRACGTALGIDLVAHPELLMTERYAALSAGWFWHDRGLNELSDRGDILAVTKRINGGTKGLDERTVLYHRALAALVHEKPPEADD